MSLRYGMFDQLEHPGGVPLHQLYRDRLGLVVRAEEAGFWGYHKSEHHLIPLDAAPSINLFLAAAAERTSRIRRAPWCTCCPSTIRCAWSRRSACSTS